MTHHDSPQLALYRLDQSVARNRAIARDARSNHVQPFRESRGRLKALAKLAVPVLTLLGIGIFFEEWIHAAACVAACLLTHTWDGAVQAWRKDKA